MACSPLLFLSVSSSLHPPPLPPSFHPSLHPFVLFVWSGLGRDGPHWHRLVLGGQSGGGQVHPLIGLSNEEKEEVCVCVGGAQTVTPPLKQQQKCVPVNPMVSLPGNVKQ